MGKRGPKAGPFEQRFMQYVQPEPNSGCWLWTGWVNKRGYGYTSMGRAQKNIEAHRASYLFFCGPIPPGMDVCHRCDVTSCVNPAHLFAGTRTDNMQDSRKKGRVASGRRLRDAVIHRVKRGEQHHNTTLTADVVRAIRADQPGMTLQALAEKYGMTSGGVWKIIQRKRWAHVE